MDGWMEEKNTCDYYKSIFWWICYFLLGEAVGDCCSRKLFSTIHLIEWKCSFSFSNDFFLFSHNLSSFFLWCCSIDICGLWQVKTKKDGSHTFWNITQLIFQTNLFFFYKTFFFDWDISVQIVPMILSELN